MLHSIVTFAAVLKYERGSGGGEFSFSMGDYLIFMALIIVGTAIGNLISKFLVVVPMWKRNSED